MKIDLSVNASRDTWVRQRANPEMEIQLTGGVRVTKEPSDSVRLDGEVDAVPSRSYVEQFGRRFSIRRGRIEFRGTVPESRVDMEAAYIVPSRGNPGAAEATITLDVEGTLDDLSLVLGSEPEMENADIVSYLATGRPASTGLSVGGDGGGGLGSIGSDYALGRVTGLVEGLAAEGIGLDVVEIEADGLRGATLVAGRFVSPRVYVGFKQPIGRDARDAASSSGADRTQVEVEYEALKWLLLNMEASNSTISFFFRFRYAY
jgi:translocation and assembly module TamB